MYVVEVQSAPTQTPPGRWALAALLPSDRHRFLDPLRRARSAGMLPRGVTLGVNQLDPIPSLRSSPELPAKDARRGWTVVFAADADGRLPALDYLENQDSASDPEFPMTSKHLDQFAGLLQQVRFEGPQGLQHRRQFEKFVGDDAKFGMCELRVVQNTGHRIICFMRDGRRFIVANGFRKPPRDETPREAKTRALAILAAHEARKARPVHSGRGR